MSAFDEDDYEAIRKEEEFQEEYYQEEEEEEESRNKNTDELKDVENELNDVHSSSDEEEDDDREIDDEDIPEILLNPPRVDENDEEDIKQAEEDIGSLDEFVRRYAQITTPSSDPNSPQTNEIRRSVSRGKGELGRQPLQKLTRENSFLIGNMRYNLPAMLSKFGDVPLWISYDNLTKFLLEYYAPNETKHIVVRPKTNNNLIKVKVSQLSWNPGDNKLYYQASFSTTDMLASKRVAAAPTKVSRFNVILTLPISKHDLEEALTKYNEARTVGKQDELVTENYHPRSYRDTDLKVNSLFKESFADRKHLANNWVQITIPPRYI